MSVDVDEFEWQQMSLESVHGSTVSCSNRNISRYLCNDTTASRSWRCLQLYVWKDEKVIREINLDEQPIDNIALDIHVRNTTNRC